MTTIVYSALLVSFLVGTSVPGIVMAVRALPPIDRRVLAGQKPWACDICMCFWATGLVTLALAFAFDDRRLMLACGPAYTFAMWILTKLSEPPPFVPPLPEDEPPP